jgi:glycosyltransferase involved in cell wall biosynthesis
MILARCSDQIYFNNVLAASPDNGPMTTPTAGQLMDIESVHPSMSQLIALRDEYDVVYISSFYALGLLTVLVCKLLGKFCVLNVGGSDDVDELFFSSGNKEGRARWPGFLTGLLVTVRHRVLRSLDAFVTNSTPVAAKLAAHGVAPHLIHTIPKGVDTGLYVKANTPEKAALREKLGLPKWATLVTCAGSLDYFDNGVSLLLRVWCEILRQHRDVMLLFVHARPPDKPDGRVELDKFVSSYHLENCVIFAEGGQSLAEYLRVSDIFVSPGEKGASEMALIEAMACQLPVVATPADDAYGIIRQGQNGLVVEAGNFQQLFDAIDTLIAYPDGASRLGRCARDMIEQHYTADSVKKAYDDLFCAFVRE